MRVGGGPARVPNCGEVHDEMLGRANKRRQDGWDPAASFGEDGDVAPTKPELANRIRALLAKAPKRKKCGRDWVCYEFMKAAGAALLKHGLHSLGPATDPRD